MKAFDYSLGVKGVRWLFELNTQPWGVEQKTIGVVLSD
jgi:hypothetical protein